MRALGESTAKVIQASLICGLILGVLGLVWPAALNLPQLWLVVFVSVLANVFQPSYQPFESSRTPEDRGTARQILWTVYVTQILAVTELVYRRRVSLPLNWVTTITASMIAFGLILAALVASMLLLLAFLRRIRHEESLMLATFPEYEAYKETTGSLVPRI